MNFLNIFYHGIYLNWTLRMTSALDSIQCPFTVDVSK